jgi:predicted helicase
MEVIAITDKIAKKSKKTPESTRQGSAKGGNTIGSPSPAAATGMVQGTLKFEVGELERALNAKLVKKCGSRTHWEDWANDIAKIAQTHISRITAIVSDPANTKEVAAFNAFAHELRDDLNDSITDSEVIEMLAQHLITKPVFDALFDDYSFASHNPVSRPCRACWMSLTSTAWRKKRIPWRSSMPASPAAPLASTRPMPSRRSSSSFTTSSSATPSRR